jgi:ABC-2 type transport system ATP-binding protein
MESKNHIVQAKEITKMFGQKIAVERVSFYVKKGEIFGFLGPNGAGKTTTIRMLTALLVPDNGEIIIDGIDISKHPVQAKLRLGVIPETSNIYADLTARQNIILSGRFYGLTRKRLKARTDELLDKFGLYDRRDDTAKTFSKGMKQKLSIASAIIHEPPILFLDEPTSGLDVQSQRFIRAIVKDMNAKGTTVFLTTHNIEEANLLCERICIINNGRIAAIDSPEKLKRTFQKTQSIEIAFESMVTDNFFADQNFTEKIEKLGDKWKLYTAEPDKLIKHLITLAKANDLTITSLQICGASLEEAFLEITKDKSYAVREIQ